MLEDLPSQGAGNSVQAPDLRNAPGNRAGELCLTAGPAFARRLDGIFQAGFFVEARVGQTIRETLCGQFGIPADYLRDRINTIFLDRRPVDDIDEAVIRHGATLALSSAMPGLVGAAMRREGFYASLRGSITYSQKGQPSGEEDGFLRLKLFNLPMADLGRLFLERGIYVRYEELEVFLRGQPDRFFEGCRRIVLDGRPLAISALKAGGWSRVSGWIRVRTCASQ